MDKRCGRPITEVNGVYEIYQNGDTFSVWQKYYPTNRLSRKPVQFGFDTEEEAIEYCSIQLSNYQRALWNAIGNHK